MWIYDLINLFLKRSLVLFSVVLYTWHASAGRLIYFDQVTGKSFLLLKHKATASTPDMLLAHLAE